MTGSPKRVLVVDDNLQVLDSVKNNLKSAGYEVLIANSSEKARSLLIREIIHLAIIDIRLEDEKQKEDTSGFDVARELSDYIPCVIFTAYDDKENTRRAYSEIKAKEILSKKSKYAASKLIDIVDKLFASDVKVNFNLKIDGLLNLDAVAAQIKIPISDREFRPSAHDVRQVFQALFHDAIGIHIAPLLSSERTVIPIPSDSVLVRVRPHLRYGWGKPVVVKFSSRDEITREISNYQMIKPFLGGHEMVILENKAYSCQIGGLVYRLIGAENWESIRTFSEVFLEKDTKKVIDLLELFFHKTIQRLFANAHQEMIDLARIYVEQLGLVPEVLAVVLHGFHPEDLQRTPVLHFKELESSFTNPILWLQSPERIQHFEVFSWKCLCYGYLNGRNILVDDDGQFWLLNFAQVAESHALRDFAALEADIKFNLLSIIGLEDPLLPFEQALLTPGNFRDQLPNIPFDNGQLEHAYQIISALRGIASRLINLEGDIREYYQALFFHTLNIMYLPHISVDRKARALLSAAIICQRLDDWPRWPKLDLSPPLNDLLQKSANQEVVNPSSPPPPGQLRILGAAAGFVIALVPYLILFWVLPDYLTALIVLIVLTLIAFAIAGLITGKDALLFLGELVKRLFDKLGK